MAHLGVVMTAAWYLGPDGVVAGLMQDPPINWVGPQLQWDLGRTGTGLSEEHTAEDVTKDKGPRPVSLEPTGFWVWTEDAMPAP